MTAGADVLQALVDTHEHAVFAVDRDLRYLAFNTAHAEAMRELYGAEIELGGCLTEYQTVEADRRGAEYHVGRALSGERLVVGAYSGEAGRSRRFYDLVHVPLVVGDEIVGVVVRTHDVTEQRQARNGLQASEEWLHRSLAAAKAGTWEWDMASGANTWSEEIWGLYDLEPDGCEPSYDLWLQSVHPDDRRATAARVGDAAAACEEFEIEWRVNTRDGSLRWLASRGSPVRDADGAVVRYLGVAMDNTQRKEAEIALRRSRGELRALVDSSPDIVFQIDCDRRLVVANAPFDQAIVTSGGEPIAPGDPILPGDYPEEFRELWRALYDRAFAGESFTVETTVPMADGAHLMENHLTPVHSDDEVTGVVVTSRDITERRRAEQDLRDSEARFRAYFEQSLIGATVISPTMAWIDVNEAACDLLGYSREELLELTWMELTHPEDLAGDVAQFKRVLAGEIDEYRLEKRYLRKDGAVVWVDRSVRCHRGEDGSVDYLLSLLSDITGLKATEHELKQSQLRLREAHRLAHIGIWNWVAETDTVTWSEELYRIAGLDPTGTAPTYAEHPTIYSTESWNRLERAVQKALATGDSYQLELELMRPDGTRRWVNAFGGVAHDVDGRVEGLHGTVQDITERRQAEDEIKHLNAELERRVEERTRDLTAANAELEEFVHSVAHDLRSPLRALSGFSEILQLDYADAIDPAGRDYLRRIHDAAGHLGELMDALLSLSRINRQDLDIRGVDLSGIARLIAAHLEEADRGRAVHIAIEDGLTAWSDPALCEIVLQNLMGNAWKFSAGESAARISFGSVTRDGRQAYCVSDNGVGFDAEYAGKLFIPFERLHTTDEFPGTGIGLATVRRAVTRLGGECWAEGEPGTGARVYFSLGEPH